jgi:hypothetical protein
MYDHVRISQGALLLCTWNETLRYLIEASLCPQREKRPAHTFRQISDGVSGA